MKIKLVYVLIFWVQVIITSDESNKGFLSAFKAFFNKNIGTKHIEVGTNCKAEAIYVFDSQKTHAVSFDIFRLQNNMIGVVDIEMKNGKRHIKITRSLCDVDDQSQSFTAFKNTLTQNDIGKTLVTLFYSRESVIVDASSLLLQKKFCQQTNGVVPVVCSYVPVPGSMHRQKENHFKYIVRQNVAECELATPTSDGIRINVIEEHNRSDKKITSPIQGVSATSSKLIELGDKLL